MTITVSPAPIVVLGLPPRSWLFALRIWIATMLALYAAFWLQIDGAASAATCVAILALQTRGQAYQKAFYRLVGTAIGAIVAIVITGLFSQTRDLFLLAFAAWVALSVYAAGLLDGNRAYGAQLSGYTVALIGVQSIDAPQGVFLASLNRSAAITVGIVALSLVNDLLAAPDVLGGLLGRFSALHDQIHAFANASRRDGSASRDVEAARLLAAVAALHPDITALPAESIGGSARSSAARRLALRLIRDVYACRTEPVAPKAAGIDGPTLWSDLEAESEPAVATLRDLRTGRGSIRRVPLPIFRSRPIAARNALRTFLTLCLSSLLFGASSWPSSSLAVSLVAVTMALSSTAPNLKAFAIGAVIAMPVAIAAVGITEFLILDGASDFPLLAIAMAPTIAVACLLLGTGKPPFAPMGFLLLVFFPVFLSPTNPQNYDPQTYLVTAALALASVAVLFVGLTAILPTNDGRKRRWMLASARADFLAVLRSRRRRSPGDLARDADRIGQCAALPSLASPRDDLPALFWMSEMAEAAASVHARLGGNSGPETLHALRTLDSPALRACQARIASLPLALAIDRAVSLIDARPRGIEAFLREGSP